MIDAPWEAAELAGILTTYITGIEDILKPSMMEASRYLSSQVDDVYDTVGPIVDEALKDSTVDLPWES